MRELNQTALYSCLFYGDVMSSIYKDPKRKVSEPTEKDFIHGISQQADTRRGNTSFLVSLAANILWKKAKQRRNW